MEVDIVKAASVNGGTDDIHLPGASNNALGTGLDTVLDLGLGSWQHFGVG